MEVFVKEIKYFINETVKKMYPKIVKKRTKPQQETTFVKQQKTVQVVSIAKRRRKTEQFIQDVLNDDKPCLGALNGIIGILHVLILSLLAVPSL